MSRISQFSDMSQYNPQVGEDWNSVEPGAYGGLENMHSHYDPGDFPRI